jgi:hypothetical protein
MLLSVRGKSAEGLDGCKPVAGNITPAEQRRLPKQDDGHKIWTEVGWHPNVFEASCSEHGQPRIRGLLADAQNAEMARPSAG